MTLEDSLPLRKDKGWQVKHSERSSLHNFYFDQAPFRNQDWGLDDFQGHIQILPKLQGDVFSQIANPFATLILWYITYILLVYWHSSTGESPGLAKCWKWHPDLAELRFLSSPAINSCDTPITSYDHVSGYEHKSCHDFQLLKAIM